MLRLSSFLAVVAVVSPAIHLDHHFGSHHLGGGSSSSSSGCNHSSSSTSSSSSSSSSSGSSSTPDLPKKHVFVTHDSFAANLGGTNGADARCAAAAEAAGATGTYIALVSSGKISGQSRVTSLGPYYDSNDQFAYAMKADFLTTSFSNIPDELGNPTAATTTVWSGSDANGQPSGADCLSWTSTTSADLGTVAADDNVDTTNQDAMKGWGAGVTNAACNQQHPLFCVEQ
jgi:hypothetical protein